MWLIDSTTIRLKFVHGPGSSPYAILSHTWNDNNEVIFQEFNSPDRDITHLRFQKITGACTLARERSIPYVWVDSCCIDKSSSAELTEAINSMFRWYKESTVCFTYLADLAVNSDLDRCLPKCKWFTRGWTLQELVAPKNVEFYDEAWNLIGSKLSLLELLSDITQMDENVLRDSNLLPNYTVAMRMSWAANRHTTREEDLAYCLLGLFDVYLPLIYGEGSNAFIRLQEAISQVTYDLSLFAWTDLDHQEKRQEYRGIFALSPAEFKGCHYFWRSASWVFPKNEYTITNKGVRIVANLYEAADVDQEDYCLLNLECWGPDLVFIRLVQTPDGYVRDRSDTVILVSWLDALKLPRSQRREIYMSKTVTPALSEELTKRLRRGYYVEIDNQTLFKFTLVRKFPNNLWNMRKGCFMIGPNEEFTGLLELSISSNFDSMEQNEQLAILGSSFQWPRVFIVLDTRSRISAVGADNWQPWAAILPNQEGNDIAHWPLECSFDIVSAVRSLYEPHPWSTDYVPGPLVVSSMPTGDGVIYGDGFRLTVTVTACTDEMKTRNTNRLVINIQSVRV